MIKSVGICSITSQLSSNIIQGIKPVHENKWFFENKIVKGSGNISKNVEDIRSIYNTVR